MWRGRRPDDGRLVVSHRMSYNATEVRGSETSYGPDFVSVIEGKHCDMETREVVPLCGRGGGLSRGCFALDGPERPGMVAGNGKRSLKKPGRVIEWK